MHCEFLKVGGAGIIADLRSRGEKCSALIARFNVSGGFLQLVRIMFNLALTLSWCVCLGEICRKMYVYWSNDNSACVNNESVGFRFAFDKCVYNQKKYHAVNNFVFHCTIFISKHMQLLSFPYIFCIFSIMFCKDKGVKFNREYIGKWKYISVKT